MLNAIRVFASDHYVSYYILLILYITEIYCHRLFVWKGKQNKWSRGKKHSNSRDVWWKIDEKYPLSVLMRFFPFSFHFFLCRINTLLIFSFHMKCCLSLSSIQFFYPAMYRSARCIYVYEKIFCAKVVKSPLILFLLCKKVAATAAVFFLPFFSSYRKDNMKCTQKAQEGRFLANETWLSCNNKEKKENSSHIML